MRLDKYLAQAGIGTRSEVKKLIRCGRVLLNGVTAKKPEDKITDEDEICVDGKKVIFSEYQYFMLNKPAGVVSSTNDKKDTTVVELITRQHSRDLFPVGRLDKDTEGLLLLTNDGVLAHELLSPKKHVEKTYFVQVEGKVTEEDRALFAAGMDIGDNKLTKPAKLEGIQYVMIHENGKRDVLDLELAGNIRSGNRERNTEHQIMTELFITITEGRYHQIKRMFSKAGKPVRYLRRISMGSLKLDESLALGEYRELTEAEIKALKSTEI